MLSYKFGKHLSNTLDHHPFFSLFIIAVSLFTNLYHVHYRFPLNSTHVLQRQAASVHKGRPPGPFPRRETGTTYSQFVK